MILYSIVSPWISLSYIRTVYDNLLAYGRGGIASRSLVKPCVASCEGSMICMPAIQWLPPSFANVFEVGHYKSGIFKHVVIAFKRTKKKKKTFPFAFNRS